MRSPYRLWQGDELEFVGVLDNKWWSCQSGSEKRVKYIDLTRCGNGDFSVSVGSSYALQIGYMWNVVIQVYSIHYMYDICTVE